jgi:RNA polymerase primary sigma factor
MNRTQQAQKMKTIMQQFEQRHRRKIKQEELAEALNISEQKVGQIRAASNPLVSLDQSLGGEDNNTIADFLVDPQEVTVEEGYLQEELQSEVEAALNFLTERERFVITRYFGLGAEEETSLEAIGQTIRLSRERVRQIRNQALQKIREGTQGERLVDYLL